MNALLHQSELSDEALALRMAALGHPARLRILRHLASRPACCCKDVVERLDLAQSTVSQHLKVLVESGLVRYTPERPRSRYEVDRQAFSTLIQSFTHAMDRCCDGRPTTSVQDLTFGE